MDARHRQVARRVSAGLCHHALLERGRTLGRPCKTGDRGGVRQDASPRTVDDGRRVVPHDAEGLAIRIVRVLEGEGLPGRVPGAYEHGHGPLWIAGCQLVVGQSAPTLDIRAARPFRVCLTRVRVERMQAGDLARHGCGDQRLPDERMPGIDELVAGTHTHQQVHRDGLVQRVGELDLGKAGRDAQQAHVQRPITRRDQIDDHPGTGA